MSNENSRSLSNNFQDVRLVSLASWSKAAEISPRDRGGPYVVTQEGYDPQDFGMKADEFVLGRSGKWLSLAHFYRMPVEDRRAEFVFGTAAEVMQVLSALTSRVAVIRPGDAAAAPAADPAGDEMAAAMKSARGSSPASA